MEKMLYVWITRVVMKSSLPANIVSASNMGTLAIEKISRNYPGLMENEYAVNIGNLVIWSLTFCNRKLTSHELYSCFAPLRYFWGGLLSASETHSCLATLH